MLILITELLLNVTLGTITFILKNTTRGISYIYTICSNNNDNRDIEMNSIVYNDYYIPYVNNNRYNNNNTNYYSELYENEEHDFEIIDLPLSRN